MSRIGQIMVACGTFSVALGIGFVMQNGDALAARFSDLPPTPANGAQPAQATGAVARAGGFDIDSRGAARVAETVRGMHSIAMPQPVMARSAPIPSVGAEDAAPVVLAALEAQEPTDGFDGPGLSLDAPQGDPARCGVTLAATAAPAAMVDLVLDAPCAPDLQATIHHQGMMFSVLTDAAGQARLSVPALAEAAVFVADIAGGDGAVAVVDIPDLQLYDRAILMWQGHDGPEIHALEFGAAYGTPGHVWHNQPGSPGLALAGQGGFLTRLGDPDSASRLMAEVYTYPSGTTARDGVVVFSVEAPVTQENCGRVVVAQTIQLSPGIVPFSRDLELNMPDCDAVGEFLAVRHLLLDLTVAAK
ncbi:MAG: hypothetical protein JJT81_13560 [Rubellimicrobium sp.]|nr:hypothetical protein [Rubellimicrobium sp.]